MKMKLHNNENVTLRKERLRMSSTMSTQVIKDKKKYNRKTKHKKGTNDDVSSFHLAN